MLLLAIALQATPTPPAGDAPKSFSILVPVTNERCVRKDASGDVVVCAEPLPSQALPYPDEVIPDRPVASNPDRTGVGALAAEAAPCAARMQGCTVGFGQPVVAAALQAVGDVAHDLFRKKYPREGRVAIPLNDPAAK